MADLATSATATDNDRLLQAEAVVRDWCGWHIAPVRQEVVTFAYPSWSVGVLLLPTLNLRSVVSVVGGEETVDAADYDWDARGWVRWIRTSSYPWNSSADDSVAVTVTVTHGYDTPPPPVTAVVQALATRGVANPGSLVRTQVGPFSETHSQTAFNQVAPLGLLEAEKAILAPYRLPKRP